MRDPRRLFTPAQRFKLWVSASGACLKCGSPLDGDWHAHHVVPHSEGGPTDLGNGQALCVECHLGEHRMTDDNGSESSAEAMAASRGESAEGVYSFNKSYAWQEDCLDVFKKVVHRYIGAEPGEFEKAFTMQVSPSGGKSTCALKLLRWMNEAGHGDLGIIVVPNNSIKLGFKSDADRFVKFSDGRPFRVLTQLESNYRSGLRNYDAVVVTYHSLAELDSLFALLRLEFGRKLVFIFDEIHHGNVGTIGDDESDDGAQWGADILKVKRHAHCIIGMTGTAIRTDYKQVPFLDYEQMQTSEGQTMWRVKPSFVYTYRQAILDHVARTLIFHSENPAITYEVSGEQFTSAMSYISDNPEKTITALVPKSHLDAAKKVIFNPHGIHMTQLLRAARAESERNRMKGDRDDAILVLVESSKAGQVNPAYAMQEAIIRLFGEHAVVVESCDGKEAEEAIKAFKESAGRWIIAKGMIGEGTSIPRIRGLVIARSVDSCVAFTQFVHRATRNRSDVAHQDAHIFYMALPRMLEYARDIEKEIQDIREKEPSPQPYCKECEEILEFWPQHGNPCPHCGFEPERKEAIQVDVIGHEVGEVITLQNGEIYSEVDPTARRLYDRLGDIPGLGGRHPLNVILKTGFKEGFFSIHSPVAENDEADSFQPPAGTSWEDNFELAGTLIKKAVNARKRREPSMTQERENYLYGVLTNEAKSAAGIPLKKGGKKVIDRELQDRDGACRKFVDAARSILARERQRYEGAA